MPNWKFYTYVHRRADTGEAFYVGKGRNGRSGIRAGRSIEWLSVVEQHGYVSEILAYFEFEEFAFEHEKQLISDFKSLGLKLCNKTNGGEGMSGYIEPAATREKRLSAMQNALKDPVRSAKRSKALSDALIGRTFSDERKLNQSLARKGRPLSESHRLSLIGKVITESHRAAISAAMARPGVKEKRSAAIAATMKGYVKSDEHRKSLSDAAKADWAKRKLIKAQTIA